MSQYETWQIVIAAAGALATFLAVAAALWIAHKDRRVHLGVTAGFDLIGSSEALCIYVTNLGYVPAKIVEVYSRVGIVSKRKFYSEFDHGEPPVKIKDHGDEASFCLNFSGQGRHAAREISKQATAYSETWWRKPKRLWARFVRVGVVTSTNKSFDGRFSPKALERLAYHAKK